VRLVRYCWGILMANLCCFVCPLGPDCRGQRRAGDSALACYTVMYCGGVTGQRRLPAVDLPGFRVISAQRSVIPRAGGKARRQFGEQLPNATTQFTVWRSAPDLRLRSLGPVGVKPIPTQMIWST
jgi:hypothetical protein